MTTKRKVKIALSIVIIAGIVWCALAGVRVVSRPDRVSAAPLSSDKYDGDCSPTDTAGRCSDKCPPGSYEIGREDTGAAICHLEPTGCPYGDAIPLDSPKCAPPQTDPSTAVINDPPAEAAVPASCQGK